MDTKHCKGCHRDLPHSRFAVRGDRPSLRSRCLECDRKRHRENEERRRARAPREVLTFAEMRRQEVAASNAFALWHGPVSRGEPLRWLA